MGQALLVKVAITINADASQVWDALTNPARIKEYLFGTEAVCDWRVGSPIVFRGEWQGKRYEDKGRILQIVPERLLSYSYWSNLSGTEDKPENYAHVTFELSREPHGTRLALTQDNASDEKSREHSEKNWTYVLETMKKLLEAK